MNRTTEFTAVHSINITVVTGYNFIVLPGADVFRAEPGDVIGYITDQPEISNSSSTSLTSNTSLNVISSPVSQSRTNTTLNFNTLENFSLYGFEPYEARVSIRIMSPGVSPLGITITDLENVVEQYSDVMTIQTPVEGLKFNYTQTIRNGTSRLIGFKLSRGTNTSCDWWLTGKIVNIKGSVNYTTQYDTTQKNDSSAEDFEGLETSFQYPHNTPDDIVFLVNCSNSVSTLSENVTISVRRNVFNFSASLLFASFAYTHAQTSWTSRAKGDHVGYKWVFDEGNYHTAEVDMNFTRSSLPGSKTRVVATAWNVVSKKNLTLWLNVLKNPLNIQFLPGLAVASNENVSISPILNWSPYSNGTSLYKNYGINISEPLRNFIEFPEFSVEIEKVLVSRNVANGTLLTYQFPKAGSKSVTHDVYIQALGHPEMNRMIEVLVMDRIDGLKIVSNCSNVVLVKKTCVFTPQFNGSDVSCCWAIDSKTINKKSCKMTQRFNELGNFTVTVDVENEISSKKAAYNISVVASLNTTSNTITPFPTQTIAPSKENSIEISSSKVIVSTLNLSPVSFTQGQASVSNSITSLLKAGPSSRSLDSTGIKSPSFTTQSSAIIFGQSKSSLSPRLNGITTSMSQPGPSSRNINFTSPSLKITGPRFAAIGQMITLYALNVASFSKLSWFVNNTWIATTNNNISYMFNHPGDFEIIVNSSSSNQNASFTVTVQELISGFQVSFLQSDYGRRVAILFVIRSGTNVSYSISLGDGSQTRTGAVREFEKNISVYHLYAKNGCYNVSVNVFSRVGPNQTEMATVFVNDTCRLHTATLYGASPDMHNPRQFSGNNDIVMALKTTLDCAQVPQLKYSWKFERLNSGIPDAVAIKLTSTQKATFTFPGNLSSTGEYKVQVTVENHVDGLNLTRTGYFSKVLERILVRIACGTARLVSVSEPLTINASVIAGSDSVSYEWFCDDAYNVACFRGHIRRNTSVVRFPGNYFNLGDVYEFLVKVRDGGKEGVASQKVTFGLANETLDLCLRYVVSH